MPRALLVLLLAAGCSSGPKPPAELPARFARADDAFAAPSAAPVDVRDFDRAWASAERAAQHFLFAVERRDRRAGVLTTAPATSAQPFEPWRRELRTVSAGAESAVATVRRTVRFEFAQAGEGWRVEPKVLVEREARAERRLSNTAQYRQTFAQAKTRGTPETDRGVRLPRAYWYPIGRDAALERALARRIEG